jgi:hypothetical protein
MSKKFENPFDTIESAYEYVALLSQTIVEVQREIETDIALADGEKADRRREALQLVAFNLDRLSRHMTQSRRALNDLRTLRRLLLSEREPLARMLWEREPLAGKAASGF